LFCQADEHSQNIQRKDPAPRVQNSFLNGELEIVGEWRKQTPAALLKKAKKTD
jgi:hypothetical protein